MRISDMGRRSFANSMRRRNGPKSHNGVRAYRRFAASGSFGFSSSLIPKEGCVEFENRQLYQRAHGGVTPTSAVP